MVKFAGSNVLVVFSVVIVVLCCDLDNIEASPLFLKTLGKLAIASSASSSAAITNNNSGLSCECQKEKVFFM